MRRCYHHQSGGGVYNRDCFAGINGRLACITDRHSPSIATQDPNLAHFDTYSQTWLRLSALETRERSMQSLLDPSRSKARCAER
jgi:hypothetical protein